jgi:hypothetical protein
MALLDNLTRGSGLFSSLGGPSANDRLAAGLMGFANSGALFPALANLVAGIATGERTDATGQKVAMQRAAEQAARQYAQQAENMDPALRAALLQSGPLAMEFLSQRLKPIGIEQQISEREAAVRARGLDPTEPHNRAFVLTGKMPR